MKPVTTKPCDAVKDATDGGSGAGAGEMCDARGEWLTGEWSACDVTCGNGTQKRHVFCFRVRNGVPQPTVER